MIRVGHKVLTNFKLSVINAATGEKKEIPPGTMGTVVDFKDLNEEVGTGFLEEGTRYMYAVELDEIIPGHLILIKETSLRRAWVN